MRRDVWTIKADVLVALRDIRQEAGAGAVMSAVAARANLPYDRLMPIIETLGEKGLVTRERFPSLTPLGVEFLQAYERWRVTLDRFAL